MSKPPGWGPGRGRGAPASRARTCCAFGWRGRRTPARRRRRAPPGPASPGVRLGPRLRAGLGQPASLSPRRGPRRGPAPGRGGLARRKANAEATRAPASNFEPRPPTPGRSPGRRRPATVATGHPRNPTLGGDGAGGDGVGFFDRPRDPPRTFAVWGSRGPEGGGRGRGGR